MDLLTMHGPLGSSLPATLVGLESGADKPADYHTKVSAPCQGQLGRSVVQPQHWRGLGMDRNEAATCSHAKHWLK